MNFCEHPGTYNYSLVNHMLLNKTFTSLCHRCEALLLSALDCYDAVQSSLFCDLRFQALMRRGCLTQVASEGDAFAFGFVN